MVMLSWALLVFLVVLSWCSWSLLSLALLKLAKLEVFFFFLCCLQICGNGDGDGGLGDGKFTMHNGDLHSQYVLHVIFHFL